eukprot:gene3534-894_t
MALGKNLSTGRSDAVQSAIMKRVRKPRFVDNGVKHAVYTQSSSKRQVAKPVQSDFAPAHDRRYTLVEQEDTIELVHKQTDSHRYTGSLFHSDGSLSKGDSPPALLVNADNASQGLIVSQIEAATKGNRLILPNLKGKSLSDLGFDGTEVQITQKASVGLRASDLAARIGDNQTSSLNSVEISRSRGSGTFVAKDLNGVDGVTAMRFVSRHDAQGNDDTYHVLQARHHLIEKMSDFKIGSLDSGIEDLLQRFQQGDIVSLDEVGDEHSRQIETKEFSASARFKISAKWDLGNTIQDIRAQQDLAVPQVCVMATDSRVPHLPIHTRPYTATVFSEWLMAAMVARGTPRAVEQKAMWLLAQVADSQCQEAM